MRRREFIAGFGSAAPWPVVVRAQQATRPVIGYLSAKSSESDVAAPVAFRSEGQNVAIEYRFADGQYDRLPASAVDLTGRRVAVIAFAGARGTIVDTAWQQLRGSNIPIVFNTGIDPVLSGFVPSLSRPAGITGICALVGALTTKHLELLQRSFPKQRRLLCLLTLLVAMWS